MSPARALRRAQHTKQCDVAYTKPLLYIVHKVQHYVCVKSYVCVGLQHLSLEYGGALNISHKTRMLYKKKRNQRKKNMCVYVCAIESESCMRGDGARPAARSKGAHFYCGCCCFAPHTHTHIVI